MYYFRKLEILYETLKNYIGRSIGFKAELLMFFFFFLFQDARFYGLSTKFEPFSNKDKPLVVQFSIKHEQNIDCGGGYLKIFDCSLDQKDMHGESPYLIMFGEL